MSPIETIAVRYIYDALFYFFCSLVGFAALWLAASVFNALPKIHEISGRTVALSGTRKALHNTILLVLLMAIGLIATAFSREAAGKLEADKVDSAYRKYAAQALARDPEFDPPLGTYHYKVTWQRAGIAKAKINVSRENGNYKIGIRAKTLNILDKIFRLRYKGEGQISAEDLAPVLMHMEHRTGSSRRQTLVEFHDDGTIESVRVKRKVGKKTKTKKRVIESDSFTIDPFSAMFMARSLEWEIGESQSFQVFTGKYRYMVKLNCQGKTHINAPGKQRDAWVITSSVKNMDKPKRKSKMGETIILLSADKAKEVLLIKSKTKYGKVTASLMKFKPMPVTQEYVNPGFS